MPRLLPLELQDHIVSFLCIPLTFSARLDLTKVQYCRCSLVSRYWARNIRRAMFFSIKLRSREHALTFLAFARCQIWPAHSILPIGKYVQHLECDVQIDSPPWLHTILHCMPHNLLGPDEGSTELLLTLFGVLGENDTQVFTPRDVYYGLPRRFPSNVRPSIQIVNPNPTGMTFPRYSDFISLLFSVTHNYVGVVHCYAIEWQDIRPTDGMAPPLPRRMKSKLQEIRLQDCTTPQPLLDMFFTTRLSETTSSPSNASAIYVVPSELHIVYTMVRCIFGKKDGVPSKDTPWAEVVSFEGQWLISITANATLNSFYKAYFRRRVDKTAYVRVTALDDEGPGGLVFNFSERGRIFSIRLTLPIFSDEYETDFADPGSIGIDWKMVDELASTPVLWCFHVRADTRSVSNMRTFGAYIKSRLTHMEAAGQLKIEFRSRKLAQVEKWQLWDEEAEYTTESDESEESSGTEEN